MRVHTRAEPEGRVLKLFPEALDKYNKATMASERGMAFSLGPDWYVPLRNRGGQRTQKTLMSTSAPLPPPPLVMEYTENPDFNHCPSSPPPTGQTPPVYTETPLYIDTLFIYSYIHIYSYIQAPLPYICI